MKPISIKVLCSITGVNEHTVRYWERVFEPHLAPERTEGGQRRYSADDVKVVLMIRRLLRDEMLTHNGALRRLNEQAESKSKP